MWFSFNSAIHQFSKFHDDKFWHRISVSIMMLTIVTFAMRKNWGPERISLSPLSKKRKIPLWCLICFPYLLFQVLFLIHRMYKPVICPGLCIVTFTCALLNLHEVETHELRVFIESDFTLRESSNSAMLSVRKLKL